MQKYKLGKLPARHDPRVPSIHRLLRGMKLPAPNLDAKWQAKIGDYGMLGNDIAGDCAVASLFHQDQTWTACTGGECEPKTSDALGFYSLLTGWNPATGANDTGLNLNDLFQYLMTTGYRITHGSQLKKLDGYASIDIADLHTMRGCIWQFGGVALGVALPTDAEDAFDAGQPWANTGAPVEGGHAIYGVGCDDQYLYAVTWGKVQKITWNWWRTYGDEAFALVSLDWLKSDRTPSGLDLAQLEGELGELQQRLAA